MKIAIATICKCGAVFFSPLTLVALVVGTDLVAIACEGEQSALSKQGMVVSAHPLATEVGLQVLKQGGNAVDAAVATTFAISVVEPFSAGIGGGGFLLYHQESDGLIQSLDFREKAPITATKDLYLDDRGQVKPQQSVNGHLSVATPGTVAGLAEVHRKYGKLSWRQLVQPSIGLAQDGFLVTDRFVDMAALRESVLDRNPAARTIFTNNGSPWKTGDRLIQTDLARTLELIARNPKNFYRGSIANAIALDMQRNGGLVTKKDLKEYRPTWRSPICGDFQQWEVCSMPPPSSGGVHLMQLLNFWQQTYKNPPPRYDSETLHFMASTMQIAYADRAKYLGDPDFVPVPVSDLTSPFYTLKRGQELSDRARPSTQVQAAPTTLLKELNDTSHLTVVDGDRNSVSLTFTVNLSFGSGAVAAGTGIVLNNEMDDFATAPGQPNAFGLVGNEANAIAPRKVPLSSMTPTIVRDRDKRFRLALGAPGGSTIITTVYQTLLNDLVYNMNARDAIAAPRLHHQWLPDQLRLETNGFSADIRDALIRKGHQIRVRSPWGNGNLIRLRPDGLLDGAADPRGEGVAAGF